MTYDPRTYGQSLISVGATSQEIPARLNTNGSSINRTDPMRLDANGEIKRIDASDESQVLACIGVAKDSVANNALCGIVTNGRLENVTVPGSLGDSLYLSKTGVLTNVKPTIGSGGFVAGDFVLFMGIVVKNQTNPLLADLMVNIRVVGQL